MWHAIADQQAIVLRQRDAVAAVPPTPPLPDMPKAARTPVSRTRKDSHSRWCVGVQSAISCGSWISGSRMFGCPVHAPPLPESWNHIALHLFGALIASYDSRLLFDVPR